MPTIRQIFTRIATFRGRVGGTRTIKSGLAHENPREPFQRFSTRQSFTQNNSVNKRQVAVNIFPFVVNKW